MGLSDSIERLQRAQRKAWDACRTPLKTAVHWGFIPAVIVAGMTLTEPKPTIGQLVGF